MFKKYLPKSELLCFTLSGIFFLLTIFLGMVAGGASKTVMGYQITARGFLETIPYVPFSMWSFAFIQNCVDEFFIAYGIQILWLIAAVGSFALFSIFGAHGDEINRAKSGSSLNLPTGQAMIKRLTILLAVWFTAACPGHAKAALCDILGLKTGMDASVRKPFIRKAPSDLRGQPFTAEIAMGDDHESIHIDFVVRVPIDKAHPEVAYLIRYNLKKSFASRYPTV